MNRALRALGTLAPAAALALASAAFAEDERDKADFSDTVTVREVHPQEARIVVENDGRTTPIFADGATQLLEGSRAIRLEEIQPGERVTVDADYEKAAMGTGRLIADRIVVVAGPEDAR
jgi:hypothetical protein